MLDEQRDATYLWDIHQAGQEVLQFVNGLTFYDFKNNKMIRYAVERQLLVIGEAANHISESFKASKRSHSSFLLIKLFIKNSLFDRITGLTINY